jgi:hypothetical protein
MVINILVLTLVGTIQIEVRWNRRKYIWKATVVQTSQPLVSV